MALAMLGGYVFEIGKTDYQDLDQEIIVKWARHERVQGNIHHVPLGKYEQIVAMSGKLVLKKNDSLDDLEQKVKEQKPLLLVFGSGFAYWVVLSHLKMGLSRFTEEGNARIQEFSVDMERYFYE